MAKILAVIVLVAAAAMFSSTALAAAGNNGVIDGQVLNRTENGSSVSGQTVSLDIYQNNSQTGSTSTKTGADGRFSFDNLNMDSGYSYQVSLNYQSADYKSDMLDFSNNATTQTVPLDVYDSTSDDSDIVIATAHPIIYKEGNVISVAEYFIFANNGDKTYIGSVPADTTGGTLQTLRFTLPPKASQVQLETGLEACCTVISNGSVIDTEAIPPGMKEISFSYTMTVGSRFTLPLTLNYKTLNYDLMVQDDGITVNSNQLTSEDPMTVQGAQFSHLSGGNFPAGTTISVNLLKQAGGQSPFIWVLITIAALLVISIYFYSTRRKKVPVIAGYRVTASSQSQLLAELARLDEEFEQSSISQAEYDRQRAAVKNQLIQQMREDAGVKDGSQ